MSFQNPYARLAFQVRNGAAADELQQELSPQLEWLVRRALRRGDATSTLGKTVHQEAGRLLKEKSRPEDSEELVHQVVDRLWAGILDQLQQDQQFGCQNTWRPDENPMLADRTLAAC